MIILFRPVTLKIKINSIDFENISWDKVGVGMSKPICEHIIRGDKKS